MIAMTTSNSIKVNASMTRWQEARFNFDSLNAGLIVGSKLCALIRHNSMLHIGIKLEGVS